MILNESSSADATCAFAIERILKDTNQLVKPLLDET